MLGLPTYNKTPIGTIGVYYSAQKERSSFSSDLIRYKSGVESVIDRFCCKAVKLISDNHVQYDYIVRALGKHELVADQGRPLDYLGRELEAASLGCYASHLLRKTRTVDSVRALPFHLRRAHVLNAYLFSSDLIDKPDPRILVIDDVYASGSTTSAIISAITLSLPSASVDVFTLAHSTTRRD